MNAWDTDGGRRGGRVLIVEDDEPLRRAFARVLDFTRDAALAVEGYQHHVAPGDGDVGGGAGSLGAYLRLGDLHDDVRPVPELVNRALGNRTPASR